MFYGTRAKCLLAFPKLHRKRKTVKRFYPPPNMQKHFYVKELLLKHMFMRLCLSFEYICVLLCIYGFCAKTCFVWPSRESLLVNPRHFLGRTPFFRYAPVM